MERQLANVTEFVYCMYILGLLSTLQCIFMFRLFSCTFTVLDIEIETPFHFYPSPYSCRHCIRMCMFIFVSLFITYIY